MFSNIYDSTKTHYIIISKNIKNDKNVGIKINIKGYVPSEIFLNNYSSLNNYNSEKLKNRVIFCANINNNSVRPYILLTQQNINHNIKLIYKKTSDNINNLKEPRLIFKKYSLDLNDKIFNNNFLFTSNSDTSTKLNEVSFQNNILNIDNEDSYINRFNVSNENYRLKKLIICYNVYNQYRKSNFYKINYNNFLNKNLITNSNFDINNNQIEIALTSVYNENNFHENQNFNLIYKNQKNNISNNMPNKPLYNNIYYEQIYHFLDNSDNKLILLNKNFFIEEKDFNFLLFNTLNNITSIKLKLRFYNEITKEYNDINNYNNITIYFFVNKYKYFVNSFYKNKIILNKNFTYLHNKIINNESNFFNNNNIINNKNKIYISFGKSILGVTKLNLFNNFKFFNNKIYITNKIRLDLNSEEENYINNANYLLENDSSNYNNKYFYNIYINYEDKLSNKILKYNINNIKNIIDFDNYINNYNNYYIINNINNFFENRNNFDENIFFSNSFLYAENENNITYDVDRFNLKLHDNFKRIRPNKNFISFDIDGYYILLNFRENYDVVFNADFKLELRDISNNLILNNNKINFSIKIAAIAGGDFKNVNCVFVYHNPSTTTDPSYLFPNNNIEVIKEPTIDNISKAIELLPGESRGNKNTTIIPIKNGSNLSRKQIQGLIGLNNIPRLLSIQPYDENFIEGRGFLNQYRIENDCFTNTDRIKFKLNSQKHSSVKNKERLRSDITNKNLNFANLVNNQSLSKNISNDCTNVYNDPNNIKKYYTPFKFFRNK